MKSRNLPIKTLVEAIKKLGVESGTEKLAVIIVGNTPPEAILDELNLQRDDEVLKSDDKDPAIFGITNSDMAMAPVPDLVLEKVALSELNR